MLQNNPHITQLQITTKSEDIGLLLCTQYWDWRSFITQLPINQSCSLHTAYSICVRLLTGRCLVCFTDRQTAVSLAEHLSGSAVHSSEQYTAVNSTQQWTVHSSQLLMHYLGLHSHTTYQRPSCGQYFRTSYYDTQRCGSTQPSLESGRKYYKKVLPELPRNGKLFIHKLLHSSTGI